MPEPTPADAMRARIESTRPALVRLAAATRALSDAVMRGDAVDDETLTAAASTVEATTAALCTAGAAPDGRAEPREPGTHFARSLLVGPAHPSSPAASWTHTDGVLEARAVFGAAAEGPSSCVHGGVLAGMFDSALALAAALDGGTGVTGTLTVKYRAPTPLHREVHFRAWVEQRSGRRTVVRGTAHVDDVLCAEAEGLFVGRAQTPRPRSTTGTSE